jgi:c-di-GMP-binding flagellar brake protein YcgR
LSEGSERRRFIRHDIVEQATIVVGWKGTALPDVHVATDTLDLSPGGARLRHPTRFIARPGEVFQIASAHIGPPRAARIIQSTGSGLHIRFDQENPLVGLGARRSRRS